MKKFLAAIFFVFVFLPFFGQNVTIQGQTINDETGVPVAGVKIIRAESLFDVSSDEGGFWRISLPEKEKSSLLFSHPAYQLFSKEIVPENVNSPITIKLKPTYAVTGDSIYHIPYKNNLSIAPVELLFLAVTLEYERKLPQKHAVGGYATALINRRFWMFNDNVSLSGIKIEPYYRYYVWSNQNNCGFAQAKLAYANFTIHEDASYNTTKDTPAQALGFGLAWGWKIYHSKLKRHTIQVVLGAKFVPVVTNEEELQDIFSGYQAEYWWDLGPGSIIDVKFTLGGIF